MTTKAAGTMGSAGHPGGRRGSVEPVKYRIGYLACRRKATRDNNLKIRQEITAMMKDMIALGGDAIGVSLLSMRLQSTADIDNVATLSLFNALQEFSNARDYVHSEYAREVMWFSRIEPSLRESKNFEDCVPSIFTQLGQQTMVTMSLPTVPSRTRKRIFTNCIELENCLLYTSDAADE